MKDISPAKTNTYCGLFVISATTLMYQVLLTRIFSVTLWYHFACFALSMAMFGITAGALIVFLKPSFFSNDRVESRCASSSILFGVSAVLSLIAHLSFQFPENGILPKVVSLLFTFITLAIPFTFSGICVCLCLTRYPTQISKLYAIDLLGAASGCLALMAVLWIVDGLTGVIVVALLSSIASILFAWNLKDKRIKRVGQTAIVCSLLLIVANIVCGSFHQPLLKFQWVHGKQAPQVLFEEWNSFSRVTVEPYWDIPFGWGFSNSLPSDKRVEQKYLTMDSSGGTPLTRFDGDLKQVEFLRYDVTNIVHYIRGNAKVLVVGIGGGRDILSSFVFNQHSIMGIEMNGNIINALTEKFGDFTGHLDRDPRVTIIHDEARSYIDRTSGQFDVLQISLVDTFAATAGGAFVLTENSLYTAEAWRSFLNHLSATGILSVSRWYIESQPSETYRTISLAREGLGRIGISDPKKHIVVIANVHPKYRPADSAGIATVLVSPTPFSQADLDRIYQVAEDLDFAVLLSPAQTKSDIYQRLLYSDFDSLNDELHMKVSPPTDDTPFFFHATRFKDLFSAEGWKAGSFDATIILFGLIAVLLFFSYLCLVSPFLRSRQNLQFENSVPLCGFFAAIGLGFMLIEVSQMQHFGIYLGHPSYGISVVLFTLLLMTGIGSLLTQAISETGLTVWGPRLLLILLASLFLVGGILPLLLADFRNASSALRIALSVAVLSPLGIVMGFGFPLGMKLLSCHSKEASPWLWGINGAMSVCASPIAIALSILGSISTAYWCGVACYMFAASCFLYAIRRKTL